MTSILAAWIILAVLVGVALGFLLWAPAAFRARVERRRWERFQEQRRAERRARRLADQERGTT